MKWVVGKVIEHREWAAGLYSLFVEASMAPFIAGQFTYLSVDSEQKLYRPYSLANAPFNPVLEFYYTYLPYGRLTPHLKSLQPGNKIWVQHKGVGRFNLSTLPSSEVLWLIATGAGLGPFLSILQTAEPWERFAHIVLLHSVHYKNQLTHVALFQKWQAQHGEKFHWIPIVTQERETSFQERIPLLLQKGSIEQFLRLKLTVANSQVMLCGNPGMVKEVSTQLQDRGLKLHSPHQTGHIMIESYWKS